MSEYKHRIYYFHASTRDGKYGFHVGYPVETLDAIEPVSFDEMVNNSLVQIYKTLMSIKREKVGVCKPVFSLRATLAGGHILHQIIKETNEMKDHNRVEVCFDTTNEKCAIISDTIDADFAKNLPMIDISTLPKK